MEVLTIMIILLGIAILVGGYFTLAYFIKLWPFKTTAESTVPVNPTPVIPTPVIPTPVIPEPVIPTPVIPTPVTPKPTFIKKDGVSLVPDVMHYPITPDDYPMIRYGKKTRDECESVCESDKTCLGYTWTYPENLPRWQSFCFGKTDKTPDPERTLPGYFSGLKA